MQWKYQVVPEALASHELQVYLTVSFSMDKQRALRGNLLYQVPSPKISCCVSRIVCF